MYVCYILINDIHTYIGLHSIFAQTMQQVEQISRCCSYSSRETERTDENAHLCRGCCPSKASAAAETTMAVAVTRQVCTERMTSQLRHGHVQSV